MTIDEVRTLYTDKNYEPILPYPKRPLLPPNGVFDEEKSIRWNNKQTERLRDQYRTELDAYQAEYRELTSRLENDIVAAGIEESGNRLSEAQVSLIYARAYAEKHSSFYEVFGEFDELISLILRVLDLSEK